MGSQEAPPPGGSQGGYAYGSAAPGGATPLAGFFGPYDAPPPQTEPLADGDLHKRIDKMVEFSAKNGPQFEALLKAKQKDNPEYSFLLEAGEGHAYYRYHLYQRLLQQQQQQEPAPEATTSYASNSLPLPSQPAYPSPQQQQQQAVSYSEAMDYQQAQQHQQGALPPQQQQFYGQYQPQGFSDAPYYEQQVAANPGWPFRPELAYGGGGGGDLPAEVAADLASVLESLTGTKEVIKSAKAWFMERAALAGPLALAMCQRVRKLAAEPERQLHVIYLVNDILFNSFQQRPSPEVVDPVALAFRPVLGLMLGAIYRGPYAQEANCERLQKILAFWGQKAVFDRDTMAVLEAEMLEGGAAPPSAAAPGMFFPNQWQRAQEQPAAHVPPHVMEQPRPFHQAAGAAPFLPPNQFPMPSIPGVFMPAAPPMASLPPHQGPMGTPPPEEPPYPLFPPGLIPGMVRKMQIGSGVPYSPISPLDIPTQIPHSTKSERAILLRVKKFFKAVGEPDPMADQYDSDLEEEEEQPRGARVPPPAMEVDPETGTLPDGSVEDSRGSGRLGLGANTEVEETQYDDLYSSYRKSRSSNYHVNMSIRAANKYDLPQVL